MKSCAFTGHRPAKLAYLDEPRSAPCIQLAALLQAACEEMIAKGVTEFVSGMALGVDMLAAETVLALRQSHPGISLVCALPCRDQAARWKESSRARHAGILAQAKEIVSVCDSYTRYAPLARDRYMIQRCDCLIAVFDGSQGGTKYTVDCARQAGKPILRIHPGTFAITREGW